MKTNYTAYKFPKEFKDISTDYHLVLVTEQKISIINSLCHFSIDKSVYNYKHRNLVASKNFPKQRKIHIHGVIDCRRISKMYSTIS